MNFPRLAAFLLFSSALRASAQAPAAPADPCKNGLQTRDEILTAVPAGDEVWSQALDKRGIAKKGDSWRQHLYMSGGDVEMPANDAAFRAALGDYCSAKAVKAASPKSAKPTLSPEMIKANEANQKRVIAEFEKRSAKMRDTLAAEGGPGGVVPAAPTSSEPKAHPLPEGLNCTSICNAVASCREAAMSDFRCRKAQHDDPYYGCGCN